MNSIYHFFKELYKRQDFFISIKKLQDFPFPRAMISCFNIGQFPDLALKLNKNKSIFTGGELIELKDSSSYMVSSFNSTIPTGKKEISKFISGNNGKIRKQMEESGDDVDSLKIRDVYYLVRGKKKNNVKVVLIHGSFFETINYSKLINNSFAQVFEEMIKQSDVEVSQEIIDLFKKLNSEQENFSKVRDVEKASVKLRFRIMTEVKAEANILNEKKYPEIKDNTINLIIPKHSNDELKEIQKNFNIVFEKEFQKKFDSFNIKHHFNGYYRVFQSIF